MIYVPSTGQKESALLVADSTNVHMTLLWLKLIETLFPGNNLAFPNFHGAKLEHLERRINLAAQPLGHSLPTATGLRKEMEICNKRQEGPVREAVSRALSHSLGTAAQYYQAPTLSDAYRTYDIMNQMFRGVRASSPSDAERGKGKGKGRAATVFSSCSDGEKEEGGQGRRRANVQKEQSGKQSRDLSPEKKGEERECTSASPRKRKNFSTSQEVLIAQHFKMHIANRQFPTSKECREFLELHPMQQRTAKDIYDKCRNVAGR